MTDADKCRANGWTVGTRIVGDEGFGPDTLEITAIGERCILAKQVMAKGKPHDGKEKGNWTLKCRDWQEVPEPARTARGRRAWGIPMLLWTTFRARAKAVAHD